MDTPTKVKKVDCSVVSEVEFVDLADVPFNDIVSSAGTQFVVPIWQRLYSWGSEEWIDLWEDLMNLYKRVQEGEAAEHFMGSIVVKTFEDKVGEKTKRTLIDGQQRLTTLLLICALIRSKARADQNGSLAEEIEDYFLFNKHSRKPEDKLKLHPTEADRKIFGQIINGETPEADYGSPLYHAYNFFKSKLESNEYDLNGLLSTIRSLKMVTIRLDEKDDPNRIFETLNYRGKELDQTDLIRNYFMMAIRDEHKAEAIYRNIWFPMQQSFGSHTWERIENLESFFRHYAVMSKKDFVKGDKVYSAVRGKLKTVSEGKVISELKTMRRYSKYYHRLLYPQGEENSGIRRGIERLNRLRIGVLYPFLMKTYNALYSKPPRITEDDFCTVLETLESYIIRRFFHRMPTHSLNRLFASLCGLPDEDLSDSLARALASKETWRAQYWPKDNEFKDDFRNIPIYRTSHDKCRFVLETLEEYHKHPEKLVLGELTVEHVMPETLDGSWQKYLGEDMAKIKDENERNRYLHSIGNLTLIAGPPNSALSNKLFSKKREEWYANSNVELTKEIHKKWNEWTLAQIEQRGTILAERALKIWPRP